MKKFALVAALAAAGVLAVVVTRTLMLREENPVVSPLAVPAFHESAVVGRLSRAVQIRTVSRYGVNPETSEIKAFHQFLKASFPQVHQKLKREDIDGGLLYFWKGATDARPVLLLSHMDVVPVPADQEARWEVGAFSGAIKDGFVWGRGAIDDKAGLMGIFEAVEKLLTEGWAPQRSVYLAFGSDEEVGGRVAKKIAQTLESRGVKIEFLLDEGGIVGEGLFEGVFRPVAFVGVAEKGYLSLRLNVLSKGGHSSTPPKRTAIGVLARAVNRLQEHPFPSRLAPPVTDMLKTLAPDANLFRRVAFSNLWLLDPIVRWGFEKKASSSAAIRTTTAPTIFHAGEKDNVLPNSATAVVNFRLLRGDTVERVIEKVKLRIDDPEVEIKLLLGWNASEIADVKGPGFYLIKEIAAQLFPSARVTPYLATGGTDARHYANVSQNAYRFLPIVFRQEDLGRLHGINERVRTADYLNAVRFYYLFLKKSA